MTRKLYRNTLAISLIVLLSASITSAGDTFQTLYDSAKKEQSVELSQKALDYAIKTGQGSVLAKSYFLLAYYQKRNFMYYEALNNYFLALNGYKKEGNIERLSITLKNIGIIYTKGGFYDRAISFYREALLITKEAQEVLFLRYQIAKANREAGNFKEAKELYQALLTEYSNDNNEKVIANCYQELGLMAVEEDNFSLAREYYTKSVEVFTTDNKHKTLAYLKQMSSIAYIMIEDENYDQAQNILQEAVRISENKSFNKTALIDIYANLADLYTRKNLTDSATAMYEKRLQYDDLKNFEKEYLLTVDYLYDYHQQRANYDKATYYHKQSVQFGVELNDFKEALINNYNRYQIAAADYKREIEIRYATERETRIVYIITCVTLLVGLLSILAYFLYKNSQRIKNARKVLENIAPIQR